MLRTTRRRYLATFGTAGLAVTAGCISSDDPSYEGTWSRRGFDDARTGVSPARGPTGGLHIAWRASVHGGYPVSTPVIADETVYHLHTRGGIDRRHDTAVSAFDAATGEERWRTTVSVSGTDSLAYHHDSVVVADDRLYVRTFEGLHALSTVGEHLWTHPVPTTAQPYPIVAPPVVTDDVVVTATYGVRTPPVAVVAVDADTGETRWRVGFDARRIPWTLSAADGTVFVPFLRGDAGVVALDLTTGTNQWSRSLPVDGPVTISADTMLVPLRENATEFVAAVARRTRRLVWRVPAGRRTESGVAVTDDLAYYCADGVVVARRLDSGDRVWSFGPDPRVSLGWTPVVADELVYAVSARAREGSAPATLYALDRETGTPRGRGRLPRSVTRSGLAVVGGAAYVALGHGELLCVESCSGAVAGRCLLE
ncbi:serine/threonine protein kinase-like protein [Haloferax mucosum ATCC BAA-1512]|uniref:Serine/threonine protein kinase-like protein n=1 Tax=Haloferax mucosum ATCC BAA-1512 TaxID=662479 RepID=M0IFE5_9EURY|nr:PQQ-binding-like beta-propeller repeat protein [Haloferax mucosum]ELZ94802.1 serine/threonine protein kinase-like protein [Haloferax mucosum ATCC BAA-1512]